MRCQPKRPAVIGISIILNLSLHLGCSEDKGAGPLQTNHRPVISLQADTSGVLGDTLRLQFTAADQDGDSLHFSLMIYCSWVEITDGHCAVAHIDSHKGEFWFYPRTYDVPTRQFTVSADDDRGGIDSTTFSVSVGTP